MRPRLGPPSWLCDAPNELPSEACPSRLSSRLMPEPKGERGAWEEEEWPDRRPEPMACSLPDPPWLNIITTERRRAMERLPTSCVSVTSVEHTGHMSVGGMGSEHSVCVCVCVVLVPHVNVLMCRFGIVWLGTPCMLPPPPQA